MSTSNRSPRVAIVTGAARGIGAGIAQRLAADGMDIAVIDLDAAYCIDTVRAVETLGRRAVAVGADVSAEASVAAAIEQVVQRLGAPTVLVNNAGILRERTLVKTSIDDWELSINVNLRGAFLMSRTVKPHMRAAQWGRIVNLSSIAALGQVGLVAYSAAKAGIQGMTRTLAIELGRHGITVNAVAPGFIATPMTAGVAERVGVSFEEMQAQIAKDIPVGRVGQPEDIANAVAFFADERSGFVSGQVLYVAGGPKA
jgi:3-oxoacyl-[acyl-carrier protein] reductase